MLTLMILLWVVPAGLVVLLAYLPAPVVVRPAPRWDPVMPNVRWTDDGWV